MRIHYRETDNRPRWNRLRRGFFETYYIKFNDPVRRLGWWIRYTFLSPLAATEPPVAALWGFFFNQADPSRNCSWREDFQIDRTRFDPDIFYVQIGEAAIYTMGARGRLEGKGSSLAWDLKFDTEGISSRIMPAPLYWSGWPRTKFLSPYFDTHVSGTVTQNGETLILTHLKGHQGHLWGTGPAKEWGWVHCNDFSGEEGVAVEMLSAPVLGSTKTLLHVRLPDRELRAGNLIVSPGFVSRREDGEWVVELPKGKQKVVVRATRAVNDCHHTTYLYPDGSIRSVKNSSVADCELLLFTQDGGVWREEAHYISHGAAAFETGSGDL